MRDQRLFTDLVGEPTIATFKGEDTPPPSIVFNADGMSLTGVPMAKFAARAVSADYSHIRDGSSITEQGPFHTTGVVDGPQTVMADLLNGGDVLATARGYGETIMFEQPGVLTMIRHW